MEGYTEVRWHGRAQQGVVTAAKLLGETALFEGKFVQAFPEFGPERMGAPVKAFNRISDDPIKIHCQVTNPRIVLIVDPTLIGITLAGGMETSSGVSDGATDGAVFIVNTSDPVAEVRKALDVSDDKKVYTVDASTIAMDTLGRHIPNTPMLGALAKVTGIVDFESLLKNFKDNYGKKFGEKVTAANVSAMERGFKEVGE
ncbi:MAG: 2-oxoacid:acceptor oxidoreductase family protein [Deltaproteobacteria bacterium]|nr:2-oxoacid:acceptor oxidoreductase family protein [Deltaproteobacteria bacterium]